MNADEGFFLGEVNFYLVFISWAFQAEIQSAYASKNAFNGRREQALVVNVGGFDVFENILIENV